MCPSECHLDASTECYTPQQTFSAIRPYRWKLQISMNQLIRSHHTQKSRSLPSRIPFWMDMQRDDFLDKNIGPHYFFRQMISDLF